MALVFTRHARRRILERGIRIYGPDVERSGTGLCQEKAEVMRCARCRTGETTPGKTTETYEIGGTVVIQEYQAA